MRTSWNSCAVTRCICDCSNWVHRRRSTLVVPPFISSLCISRWTNLVQSKLSFVDNIQVSAITSTHNFAIQPMFRHLSTQNTRIYIFGSRSRETFNCCRFMTSSNCERHRPTASGRTCATNKWNIHVAFFTDALALLMRKKCPIMKFTRDSFAYLIANKLEAAQERFPMRFSLARSSRSAILLPFSFYFYFIVFSNP